MTSNVRKPETTNGGSHAEVAEKAEDAEEFIAFLCVLSFSLRASA